MDLAGEKVNDLQVTRYNASVTSVSDASFAEVRRMRQQECVLLDELELLRRDKEAALKERDAALRHAAEVEAACEKECRMKTLEAKHALEVCRIVRGENERLRKASQNKEERMHKQAVELGRDLKAAMASSDQRMKSAESCLEQQHSEIVSAKSALRNAVEEHNMMAQEYYSTMEKFSQLHEDLEYSQASHSMISADCEELEIQLHKQGHTARKRLNELSRERDQLQQTLQERNAETRAACEATLEAANSSLACQTEEAVQAKSRLTVAKNEIADVRKELQGADEQCAKLNKQVQQLEAQAAEAEKARRDEAKRREQAELMVRSISETLGATRDEVESLNHQKEEIEILLRNKVNWQEYQTAAFLAGSDYSKRSIQVSEPDEMTREFMPHASKHLVASPSKEVAEPSEAL